MRILLANGLIYDGSGDAPFSGDVLIEDDRVLAVGAALPTDFCESADRKIDLAGLSVSPGFIDAHSHNDWFAIRNDPRPYFEPFVRQGITSVVAGNCGLSAVGYEPGTPHKDAIGGGLFSFADTRGDFPSAGALLDGISGRIPCNLATLVGHCSVRAGIAGSANRPLSEDEEARLLAIIERNLAEGACGVSLGLMYEPGLYADAAELRKVAALCEKYDKPLTVHPRAQSAVSMSYPLLGRAHLLRAIDELDEITRDMKVKLQYSHLIFVGRSSFRYRGKAQKLLRAMRKRGVDAMFDIYCETVGVSVITVILPAWYQALSNEAKASRANRLKLGILVKATSLLLGFGFKDIRIAYIGEGHEAFEGKTVHEIARERGSSDLETYLYLCELSGYKGRVNMGPYSDPSIIKALSRDELSLFMTDAWVEAHGLQNPAIYDNHPKFLKLSLLGEGDTLPRTIRKMTGAVADRFRLKDRGYIKPGFFADIAVFDEEKLRTGKSDASRPFGIERVFINGRPVLSGESIDAETFATAGVAMKV